MTTMRTEDLIRTLSQSALPVERLSHPAVRAVIWMLISVVATAAFVLMMGLRSDIADKIADPRFVIEEAVAIMTSFMAAAAAFCAGCPGRPLWERFAPLPFLAIWLGSLGQGCLQQEGQTLPGAAGLSVDLACFQIIVLVSIIPALIIFAMIRKGAPIAPMVTTGLAALAASALGAAALRLFHTQDASLMLLVWQFGSVLALATAGVVVGKLLLRWSLPSVVSHSGPPKF